LVVGCLKAALVEHEKQQNEQPQQLRLPSESPPVQSSLFSDLDSNNKLEKLYYQSLTCRLSFCCCFAAGRSHRPDQLHAMARSALAALALVALLCLVPAQAQRRNDNMDMESGNMTAGANSTTNSTGEGFEARLPHSVVVAFGARQLDLVGGSSMPRYAGTYQLVLFLKIVLGCMLMSSAPVVKHTLCLGQDVKLVLPQHC
jgi:hypothetical protein